MYFPDYGGYLNAVNASNGSLLWQASVPGYTGVANAISRSSPVVDGDRLILGDNFFLLHPGGAHVFAVDRQTGKLLWKTQVDSNPAAIITGNPVVYGNEVIVGVSSNEETDALLAFYPCCTFRGSVVALSAATGQILWKTYTVPANAGPCKRSHPADRVRLHRRRRVGHPGDRPGDGQRVRGRGQQLHHPRRRRGVRGGGGGQQDVE